MTVSQHTRSASPITLLREWRERTDGAALHEALFLGLGVDLPFLERVAVPLARDLSARVAILGDAAQETHDPSQVRGAGRDYLYAPTVCPGALRAKLVVLIGEHACRIAIGGGSPALPGWAGDDRLWTVVETEDDASNALLADVADWLDKLPDLDAVAMAPWAAEHLREIAGLLTERHILADETPGPEARLLDNLDRPLLDRLPSGPVDELHLYAPVVDPAGETLRELIARLAPARVVLGVHENWSGHSGAVLRSALAGRPAEVRVLPEQRLTHGRFVQWRIGEQWSALTGNADLSRAGLGTTAAAGGGLDLAVHTVGGPVLALGEGRTVAPTDLDALRGVAATPELVLLGARADGAGLHVVLAGPAREPVTIATSVDGSAGSWRELGAVPAGATSATFPPAAGQGPAVRGSLPRADGGVTHSGVVFAYSPATAARPSEQRVTPRAEPTPAATTPAPVPAAPGAPEPPRAPAAPVNPPPRPVEVAAPAPTPAVAPVVTPPPLYVASGTEFDAAGTTTFAPAPAEDSPYAEAIEEFAAHGWVAGIEDGIWRITGSFGNPVPIAAVAATRLAQYGEPVLIQAGNERRWAFMAWHAPDLTLLNWPARNWRSYQIRPPADPESRFRGGDLASVPGRVGPLNRQIGDPPPALLRVLDEVGIGFAELVKTLQEIGG
ncbi:hypothetical protein [Embleya scabrispora]|uniref:hypothetical protein n=1 Tax=Embleya scabrispora TaxID=159449 RepID=UPI000C7DDB7C|nr:hypothetical protein [Embleya scabrispora]